jgi:hypothetical protein
VARRRQYALVPLVDSTLIPNPNPDLNSLSNKDVSIADINNDIEDIGEIEIGGPSGIGDSLAISSSNELLDPLITQVAKNETDSKSDDNDEDKVIPSTYPPLSKSL